MFVLVDCNNFFASCEQVFNPKLLHMPLVILSNNDGCVIARSKEAKALGIPMGAPIFQYQSLVKSGLVQTLSSNFALYGDMSDRVMMTLSSFGFPMEIYSIDEAFLLLNDDTHDFLENTARQLYKKVKEWTGIAVSIGIAPTKTLAKLANLLAKKTASTPYFILKEDSIDEVLNSTPVEDIWGIGSALSRMLRGKGIFNALQLKKADDHWIKTHLKTPGLKIVYELRGQPCLEVEDATIPNKGILSSRSFKKEITHLKDLMEALAYFAAIAAEKLRKQHLITHYIRVFIEGNRFKTNAEFLSSSLNLPVGVRSTRIITDYAHGALKNIFKESSSYKRAGIFLGDLSKENSHQEDLFEKPQENDKKLMTIMDQINHHYGKKSLFFASEGLKKDWQSPQNLKSPCYTSSWDELPIAKA